MGRLFFVSTGKGKKWYDKKNENERSASVVKRKINLIGLFVLCLMLISATVLASPKSDLRQVWDSQIFGNARYQIVVDTKMALFGTVQNRSIVDVKRDPFFIRSEDSVTMFGSTETATSYAVQDGDKLRIYTEETTKGDDGVKDQWVCYEETLPSGEVEEISDLLLSFDEFVRSVKLLDKNDDKQLYHVTLDGRTFYNSIKKYHEKGAVLPLEGKQTAEQTVDPKRAELMRAFTQELLETWKNTDAVTMMVMVADNKIVGMQAELAPQMNAATHIFATAMDAREGSEEIKVGALAEAFMKVDSMKLTIIEVGEAEFSSVPEDIVKTATMKGSLDTNKLMTSAMEGEHLLEPSEKK